MVQCINMKHQLSVRLAELPVSSVRRLIPYANKAKDDGVTVYHLNIGEPDIKSPSVMIEALKNWNINPIAYAPSGGTKDYLNALKWYYQKLGHTYISTKDILGTTAGSEAINMAMFATCNPGDEIIVFEPFYSSYATSAKLWGITLVPVETMLENGFHLPSRLAIERKIGPKTKAILYSSPCNPTGVVYRTAEVAMLLDISRQYNLFLISDEVYREYTFTDEPATSLLSYMRDLPEQAIVLDSLSKRYSICGARLGCLVSLNQDILAGALKFAMSRLSGGLVDQYIGAQLTEVPDSYIENIRKEYKARRDVVFEGLQSIGGIRVSQPEGAFYIFAELPVENAQDFCIWLLEKYRDNGETVMLAPGVGFYATRGKGENTVRIAYVLEIPKLKRALEMLKGALHQYCHSRPDVHGINSGGNL